MHFLRRYEEIGDEIFSPDIIADLPYYQNALVCIRYFGSYFEARSPEEIVKVAKRFAARFDGKSLENSYPGASKAGLHPVVLRVKNSDYYQVEDGNHRAAIAIVQGHKHIHAYVRWQKVETPIQRLLQDVAWQNARPELYQPINQPEVQHWRLVRSCTDRFLMIRKWLAENDQLPPANRTYLDVGSSYGWFVKRFEEIGFESQGVEMDPAAIAVGMASYNLAPSKLIAMDCVSFLRAEKRTFDVVSCFSVLHHFVMGRGCVSAENLLGLLDSRTSKIFLFDTGQGHEEWFRGSLQRWDPDFIEQWIKQHSTFRRISRLGCDGDNKTPLEKNYGRTLFACTR